MMRWFRRSTPRRPWGLFRAFGLELALLATISAALLPSTLEAWLSARSERQQLVSATEERLTETAQLGAAFYDQVLVSASEAMAIEPSVVALAVTDVAACTALLRNRVAAHPFILGALLVSRDGTVLCTSGGPGRGMDLSDRPYIRQALLQDALVVSDPLFARVSERFLLPVAKRLGPGAGLAGQDEEPAVVAAAIDLDGLAQRIGTPLGKFRTDRDQPGDYRVWFVDAHNRIVGSWPHPLGETGMALEIVRRTDLGSPDFLVVRDPFDGRGFLVGAARDLPGRMQLLVGGQLDVLLDDAARELRTTLMRALMSMLIGWLLALALARFLVLRPIGRLEAAAIELAAGKRPQALPSRLAFRQLETFRQAFARMTEDILRREEALRERNRILADLAHRDSLTGLPNRRAFDLALDEAWETARSSATPVGLLIVDVDHFKAYNDTYGHLQGDACLQRVAGALAKVPLRPNDLLARLGGEEFAVLLPGANASGVARVGERLREAVAELAMLHEGSPHGIVTVSIGGASAVPAALGAPKSLLAKADRLLYRAKEAGRDRVVTEAADDIATAT